MGQLFVLSLLMRTKEGEDVMSPRFDREFDKKRAEASTRGSKKAPQQPLDNDDGMQEQEEEEEDYFTEDENDPDQETPAEPQELDEEAIHGVLTGLDLGFLKTECNQYLPSASVSTVWDIVRKEAKQISRNQRLFGAERSLVGSSICDYRVCSYQPLQPHGDDNSPTPPFHPVSTSGTRKECSIKLSQAQVADLLEEVLAFHAYLKYGGHLLSDASSRDLFQVASNTVLNKVKVGLARDNNSHQWKVQKFLECLHFGRDHYKFGPPVLHNTDTGERGLKLWGKAPAKRAQKRGDSVFKSQVANNTLEGIALQRLSDLLPRKKPRTETAMTTGVLAGRGETTRILIKPGSVSAMEGRRVVTWFPTVILEWFTQAFRPYLNRLWRESRTPLQERSFEVQLIWEITIPDSSGGAGEKLRAHPNYVQKGPWNDYVSINYGSLGQYPGLCVCFFEWPLGNDVLKSCLGLPVPESAQFREKLCLVQEANYRNPTYERKETLLYQTWNMASKRQPRSLYYQAELKCLEARSISHKVFAVEPVPAPETFLVKRTQRDFDILLVLDRRAEWPAKFLSLGKEPSRNRRRPQSIP